MDLSQLPGAQQAIAYIVNQVALWEQLPTRIQRVSAQAMTVQGVAQQRGDSATAILMGNVIGATGPLLDQVNASGPLIGQVLGAVNAGTVDTSVVATALRLAAMMTAGFAAERQLENAVASAAARTLTPDQRATLGIGGVTAGTGSDAGWWVAAGAAVLGLAWWARRRRRGR